MKNHLPLCPALFWVYKTDPVDVSFIIRPNKIRNGAETNMATREMQMSKKRLTTKFNRNDNVELRLACLRAVFTLYPYLGSTRKSHLEPLLPFLMFSAQLLHQP